jgi:Glycosyltransferase family 9 (heptosyltransferase)
LGNISESQENPCTELLDLCLRGEAWPSAVQQEHESNRSLTVAARNKTVAAQKKLTAAARKVLDRAIELDEGRALLSIVVERLGDLFEPRLCEVYRGLFTEVIERVAPELHGRIRSTEGAHREMRALPREVERVYVLSRVTLGADVAVTSVLLDAAKRRFPRAAIIFIGPRKSYEMFEADPRVTHRDAPYARAGSLRERLRASAGLWIDDGIVIDPDSRFTQLGLISVCDEDRYFHFESRSFGGDGSDRLPELASRWAQETLGLEDARAYIAPLPAAGEPAEITMSLGVGENPAKRIGGDFERDLVSALTASGKRVLIDKGGSAEERARVEKLEMPGVSFHDGSFAHFAAEIARSKLYVGYDSAGGHVASACGAPAISIFAGAVSDRFLARWRPSGTLIRVENPDVIGEVRRAVIREMGAPHP